MKLPNKLILFCEEYNVKIVSRKEMNRIEKDGDTQGVIDPNRKLIMIANDVNMEDVFWHEVGHYFASITGKCGRDDNEAHAQVFSELIRGILKQLK